MTQLRDDAGRLAGIGVEGLEAILAGLGILVGAPSAEASGSLERLRQRSMMQAKSALVDQSDLRELQRRGQASSEDAENVLRRSGYSDKAVKLLAQLHRSLLGLQEILDLHRREQITDEYARISLSALGYDGDDARDLLSLENYVPTAQDVVSFAVREVYSPEIAERFGQFEDFPEEALTDWKRAGVTRELARKYWAAHWGLPSVTLGFEMYHRRAETGVTLDDLRLLLRSQDVMPFWRDKIVAVSTAPYTRVDIRRMHKIGVLKDSDLPTAYRDIGYNDARAEKLSEFTRQLNVAEDDADLDPFRSGLKSRALAMYQRGALSASEVQEALQPLGFSEESVTAFVEASELTRLNTLYEQARSLLGDLYVRGHIDEAETRKRLSAYAFSDREISDAFTLWELKRELREPTEKDNAERDLTKAEIVDAYRAQLIPEADAGTMLERLGYDQAERTLLLHRAQLAQARQDRAEAEAQLKLLYVNGRVEQPDVRGQLGALGVSAERVQALLYRWDDERASLTPHLSVAQIQRAYVRKLFSREEAAMRLDALGYDIDDREVLIALATAPQSAGE